LSRRWPPLSREVVPRSSSTPRLLCSPAWRWISFNVGSLKKARPETLRSFYYAHNSRSESLIKVRLEKFAAVLPITEDSAVIEPLAFVTKMRSASDVGMDARRNP
jgi:hypothetical protein